MYEKYLVFCLFKRESRKVIESGNKMINEKNKLFFFLFFNLVVSVKEIF